MVWNLFSGCQTLNVYRSMYVSEVNDSSCFSLLSLFVFVHKGFSFTEAAVCIFNCCLVSAAFCL